MRYLARPPTYTLRERLTGLYAITDANDTDPSHLVAAVDQALSGGASIIQYRDKSPATAEHQQRREITANRLRSLTQQHHALLIINDDIALAQHSNADGVHLGQHDSDIAEARKRLGADAIIGVSCYNRFSLAQQAIDNGADYIAFGRFFPSRTKPDAALAKLELLQQAKYAFTVPIVAIGGITANNGGTLITAGADMLAVVDDLFGKTNIASAAHRYQSLFDSNIE